MTGRRLLSCAPVLPALTGNGLAMRAGTILRALAERYQVSLLVTPRYWSPASELPASIAERYEQTGRAALAQAEREASDAAILAESRLLHDFDRVYVCSEGDRQALESRRATTSTS